MGRYDIHFQPVPPEDVYGFKVFTFGYEAALKVTGLQSLVNRWVKTFVTPKGSDATDLNYGTSFGALPGSNITSYSDLKDSVFLALTDANEQVRQQDVDGLYPQNERLRDAALLNVVVDESVAKLEVWVRITNMAGERLTVRLAEGGTR